MKPVKPSERQNSFGLMLPLLAISLVGLFAFSFLMMAGCEYREVAAEVATVEPTTLATETTTTEYVTSYQQESASADSHSETAQDPEQEKGVLGQLLDKAKSSGSSAASKTGQWVKEKMGHAQDSGEQTLENAMDWASHTFESLKAQGLTTAQSTSEWLQEDWKNMDRWEYSIMTIEELDDDALSTKLNELGKEGWECFQIVGSRYFFKKPSSSYLRSLPFKDAIKLVPLMGTVGKER